MISSVLEEEDGSSYLFLSISDASWFLIVNLMVCSCYLGEPSLQTPREVSPLSYLGLSFGPTVPSVAFPSPAFLFSSTPSPTPIPLYNPEVCLAP